MASTINATTSSGIVATADNTGSLALQTSGTTAVTIDTSQNVGIGTTSPTSFGANTHGITLDGTGNYQHITWKANGTIVADAFTNGTAGFFFGTETSSPLQFQTAGIERMRITSTGQLLVGTTSSTQGHYLGGDFSNRWTLVVEDTNSSLPNGINISYSAAAPNNTARDFIYANDTGGVRFSVRSNGGIANYSANNSNLSDAREKTNIELAGSYLDKICAIPVKTFNYIDQNMEEDGGLTLGVIAQDVQAVAPELVLESNWGTEEEPKERLSIYQTDLQYALMKCIQEQQTIINDLKARVTALEAK